MAGIKYDGVSFNRAFVLKHRTEAGFLRTMNDKSYAHIFKGEAREEKLKEVYALVHPKKSEEEK